MPGVIVQELDGRGKGLVSQQNYESGEVIFQEEPISCIDLSDEKVCEYCLSLLEECETNIVCKCGELFCSNYCMGKANEKYKLDMSWREKIFDVLETCVGAYQSSLSLQPL